MTSVLSAIENNNVRILELLVAVPGVVAKKELNQALMVACKNGQHDAARVLLKVGADPDFGDSCLNTVLKIAAVAGHTQVVHELIEANCDVNLHMGSQGTALHHAAKWGKDACVQALIAGGAKVDILDGSGETPLLKAAKECRRSLSAINRLIQAGCNLNAQDKEGRTAMHYTSHKAMGTELLLAAGGDPDLQDIERNAPIHLAAIEGFDAVVDSLVEYKCNPDLQNIFGKTALHYLAMKNHVPGIKSIGHVGGNVDIQDNDGNLPLWYAVNHNRPEAVKALLKANCSTDPPADTNGQPTGGVPLKTALEKCLYGMAKLLILAGCKLAPLYTWLAANMDSNNNNDNQNASQPPSRSYSFVDEDEADDQPDDFIGVVVPLPEPEPRNFEKEAAIEWFEEWLHTPHSLRQLCRISLRHVMGPCLLQKEIHLPVPQSIRDYITLKEVEDHHVPGFLL